MSSAQLDAIIAVDSILEDLEQGDQPTSASIKSARKAFDSIKRATAPVLFTDDEVALFLDARDLFVRESCPSFRLDSLSLDDKETLAQRLAFKMMGFVSEEANPGTAVTHVRNALDLLQTIHIGNETRRSQDILRAAMRSLQRALGEL